MNSLEGYPIHVAHLSVARQFAFGEQVKLVFTTQISNLTNSPHFMIPNNNISNPNAGAFTASSLPVNSMPERLGTGRSTSSYGWSGSAFGAGVRTSRRSFEIFRLGRTSAEEAPESCRPAPEDRA